MHLPKDTNNMKTPTMTQQHNNDSDEHDFKDFLWMAEEDLQAFDEKVYQEIDEMIAGDYNEEEEEFLHNMLMEEELRDTVYYNTIEQNNIKQNSNNVGDLNITLEKLTVTDDLNKSTLNPDAAEFVPRQCASTPKQNGTHKKTP